MPPTEHQKQEWVEAIKRDFPRLAAQQDLVKMMVDVYASSPKHVQSLASRLERTKSGVLPCDDPRFPGGLVPDAVEILSSEEGSNPPQDGHVA